MLLMAAWGAPKSSKSKAGDVDGGAIVGDGGLHAPPIDPKHWSSDMTGGTAAIGSIMSFSPSMLGE